MPLSAGGTGDTGNNGIIKILGAEIYDIENREITLDCAEAARKIVD